MSSGELDFCHKDAFKRYVVLNPTRFLIQLRIRIQDLDSLKVHMWSFVVWLAQAILALACNGAFCTWVYKYLISDYRSQVQAFWYNDKLKHQGLKCKSDFLKLKLWSHFSQNKNNILQLICLSNKDIVIRTYP